MELKVIRNPKPAEWENLLQRPAINLQSLEAIVRNVLLAVRKDGDEALKKYTLEFDKVSLDKIEVSADEIEAASEGLDENLKNSIRLACKNIETFHRSEKQNFQKIETMPGVKCWQKAVGIEKVGLYIPGGTAPLFSTVLMLGIPAQIAGCRETVLCTPPDKEGNINPAILFAAQLVGIKKIFKVGGVQAIAAMAYGTESVPKVYKIFGPGNRFVMAAKQMVSTEGVAIDMPAGPSEVAILADESANPVFVAADMLSQAEHGIDSQVLLVTNQEALIEKVNSEIARQLDLLPRKEIAAKSLANSKIILLSEEQAMVDLMNQYAPEHLIISMKNYSSIAEKITNAGSVFLGNYSPESAGDYASGTNHTLPTHGYAKAYNGVNLDSFVRKITFQEITREGLQQLGPSVETMAQAEQLQAHSNAVTFRIKE